MMCDCIKATNEALVKEHDTRLRFTIPIYGDGPIRVILSTERIKGRKRPLILAATYCPFCGERYIKQEEQS